MDSKYYIEIFNSNGVSQGFYKTGVAGPTVVKGLSGASALAHDTALATAELLFSHPFFVADVLAGIDATVRIGRLKLEAEYVFDRASVKVAQLDREIKMCEEELARVQNELYALKKRRQSA